MAKNYILFPIDLQVFAEGGAGGEGGTGGEGATGAMAAAAGQQTKGAKNPLASVVYGKQPEESPAAGEMMQAPKAPDLSAEFEELIKGKYKAQYDQRMQDTVKKRLKSSNEAVEKYTALTPALEMLSKRYGVDVTDAAALSKAIQDDDAYYEQEAMEKGMTVENLKAVKKMERENAELRRQMRERESKENADRLYAQWMQEQESLKQIYPTFDLNTEMQSAKFQQLLKANIPMQTAYEVIHRDEIIPAAMQFAAQKTEAGMAAKIAANRERPVENGMRSKGAAATKSNVSQLTKQDRAEIIRRVARGEKISF